MSPPPKARPTPRLGIALGSGSARGWSHIGVLRALHDLGIEPDIVCGTSIGGLIGGLYVSGALDEFESWVLSLDWKQIARYLDMKLVVRGGFFDGERLMAFLSEHVSDPRIEDLPRPFAVVATELSTGQEIWLREGSLLEAIRMTIALPGLFTPVPRNGHWLVDGGLVNPVPVSLCRAMGAERVIAVNLNGDIVGRNLRRIERAPKRDESADTAEMTVLDQLSRELKHRATGLLSRLRKVEGDAPGLFDVLAGSLNIMQDRITRSRMAGDPPDLMIAPRLGHIGLLEFDRAREAIRAGRKSVEAVKASLQELMEEVD